LAGGVQASASQPRERTGKGCKRMPPDLGNTCFPLKVLPSFISFAG